MTLTELRAFTRFLTNTNSTTYSDADTLANLNAQHDVFVDDILQSMDDWDFQAETATASLVAGQQEYTLPSDIIKLKRIEVSYDGTNWYTATPMDINEKSDDTSTTSIANDFSTAKPYYDLMDGSLFLYPIPSANVTAGLKIWYEKNVTALSGASDTPSILRSFHKGLAYGAAEDYFDKYSETNKSLAMKAKKDEYRFQMKETYRKRHQDRPYTVMPSYVNYDYGNE
jgi:hypothetical protein